MSHEDIKALSDAYRSIYSEPEVVEEETEERLNEAKKDRRYGLAQADKLYKRVEKSLQPVEKAMAEIEKHYNPKDTDPMPNEMKDIKKAQDLYKEFKKLAMENADNISNLYEDQ